jgi:hypothetical protein
MYVNKESVETSLNFALEHGVIAYRALMSSSTPDGEMLREKFGSTPDKMACIAICIAVNAWDKGSDKPKPMPKIDFSIAVQGLCFHIQLENHSPDAIFA